MNDILNTVTVLVTVIQNHSLSQYFLLQTSLFSLDPSFIPSKCGVSRLLGLPEIQTPKHPQRPINFVLLPSSCITLCLAVCRPVQLCSKPRKSQCHIQLNSIYPD